VILDSLGDAEAARQLRVCCGAHRWVDAMVAARPFKSPQRARDEADRIWNGLARADWLEAFDHHPRIGEKNAAVAQDAAGAAFSSNEQSRAASAGDDMKGKLARVNAEYERRFGYIYIVCASGKGAEELLAIARQRMSNDPDTELRVAAEEQRKIMQLRLAKLLETT
jgi:2-oxo-4-hydroxy-4-carboxy-5-ureidoimidazoline decarboxylase